MLFSSLLTAAILPVSVIASQIPIIEKNKLSKIISESRYLSLHRSLCEIPSTSDHEHDVAKWLEHFLESHHFKVELQAVPFPHGKPKGAKQHFNVYAWPDPKHYKHHHENHRAQAEKKHHDILPKVLLTSHIDAVPPHIPYSISYNGSTGRTFNRSNVLIHGRGTVDDKACVAAQITAAMDFLTHLPAEYNPTDIALLFVVNEESSGIGMRHFSNSTLYHAISKNLKAILFGEPTEAKLVAGHKGIVMFRFDAYGKAAHSGYPWLGKSANSMLLPALYMLDKLADVPVEQGGLPGSEKFGNTTINVGLIQGGVAANVVPEYAHAEVAFRLAGGTKEENVAIIERAVAKVDPEGLLKYEIGQGYGPIDLDFDVPGFESIVVNYGTDVPMLQVAEGVKRYLYGPGTIFVAHGANEALTVGELEQGLEGYRRLLKHALSL